MRLTISRGFIVFLSLTILYGGASLLGLNRDFLDSGKTDILRRLLIGGGLAGLLFCFLRPFRTASVVKKHPKKPSYEGALLAWLAFSLVTVFTSIVKAEWGLLAGGLWFLFGVPFFFFLVIPFVTRSMPPDVFLKAFIVGHLPYLATFYYSPWNFNVSAYFGIWQNPNNFGIFSATLMAGTVYFLHRAVEKNKPVAGLFWGAMTLLFFILILSSGSRTSLVAGVFLAGLLIVMSRLRFWVKISLFLVSLLGWQLILYSSLPIFSPVQIKFSRDTHSAAILSGREKIWEEIIRGASLVGNEQDYFNTYFGIGGHNSFIEVLGVYGIIACFMIILFFCVSLGSFVARFRFFDRCFQFVFVEVFFLFTILSCGEGMLGALGRGIQLLFLTMIGILIYKLRNKEEIFNG